MNTIKMHRYAKGASCSNIGFLSSLLGFFIVLHWLVILHVAKMNTIKMHRYTNGASSSNIDFQNNFLFLSTNGQLYSLVGAQQKSGTQVECKAIGT